MQWTGKISSMLLLVALLVLQGCASVPMTSMSEDASAKEFKLDPDKSSIYVYRNENFGSAITMTVSMDGRVAGQTGPKTYFLFQVPPGEHEVGSIAENNVNLKLKTEAGKVYYVWQEVKMGFWMARSVLHEVDEETARKAIAECKRAQSAF
jgi:hypothetical protein